jgi:PAS domain S-box-containing protein
MPPKAIKKPGSRNLGAARPADDKRSGGAEVRSSSPPGQADIEPASLLAKTTEALRESNERFRAFLDHAPCLAFVKGTDGRYLYVNRRFEEVFFARHVTVVGKTDVELFPREQAAQFQSHDRQVLESARAMEFEETAEYTDGLHTSIVVKFPLRDAVGRIYALGGIVTDITARKRAEEALREKEDLTRAFLENSATVAWMKDAEGRHVYVSPTFERRFNLRLKDWVGKTDFDLWPPDIADTFRANDRIVLEENRRLEVIERSRNADGSSSWWLSSKFPYRDAVGRKYVGGLGVEITARKYAEEELQRSQAELRRQRERLQDLASKLITAQERERQRIARDLHDDFSQRLAALVLDMASLEQQPPVLPELIPASLALLREQLEQLSDDLHNLAYQLHPSLP